jgi:hypothetical protein
LIDDERGVVIVVEGAKAFEASAAGGAQIEIAADQGDNVVGFFDLLDPIVRQGPPVPLKSKPEPQRPNFEVWS